MLVLLAKVMGVILFFMLARWSWPRFRFDQLMNLAWKVMLPLGMVNLVAVAAVVEYRRRLAAVECRAADPGRLARRLWSAGCLAAMLVATCTTDNRPRIEVMQPPEFEPEAALSRSAAEHAL